MWTPPERIKHPVPEASWPTAETAKASHLFSPLSVGRLHLRSRTWVPAMVPWRATEEGEVTEAVLQWYGRFAEGKPGAIVVEATGIRDVPSGPLLRIGLPRYRDGLRRLADTIREASDGETRALIQLIDFLPIRRRPAREKYFLRFLAIRDRHYAEAAKHGIHLEPSPDHMPLRMALTNLPESFDPSVLSRKELEDLRWGYRERVYDTHIQSVSDLPQVLPEAFANAAKCAETSGFDGVELHFAHAYTLASFLSATNTREDGYGGTLENRLRLPLEVFSSVREAVGEEFVVGCRILGDEIIEGGTRLEESRQIAVQLAQAGMDFISVSTGGKFEDAKVPKVGEAAYPYTGQSGYECMPSIRSDPRGPFLRNVHTAGSIRNFLRENGMKTPVVAAGGVHDFDGAEGMLRKGIADLVASARQTLADPDWFEKMRQGEGRAIRRCTFTNYCEALDQSHKEVTCRLWDRIPGSGSDLRSRDGKRRLIAPRWKRTAE